MPSVTRGIRPYAQCQSNSSLQGDDSDTCAGGSVVGSETGTIAAAPDNNNDNDMGNDGCDADEQEGKKLSRTSSLTELAGTIFKTYGSRFTLILAY